MGQPLAESKAWLRIQVFAEGGVGCSGDRLQAAQLGQAEFGFAERSAGVQPVAGARARAQNGLSRGDFTKNRRADEDAFVAGRVATGECARCGARSATQTAEETDEPFSREFFGEREAQQKACWLASHSGDVADSTGEAFPADGVGRMFLPEEVRAFKEPIAGQDRILVTGPAPKRGVVTERECKGRRLRGAEGALNQLDQVLFNARFAHGQRVS